MAIDIKATLLKSGNAAKFTGAFITAYMSPAFGAHSKTEIDLLVLLAPQPRAERRHRHIVCISTHVYNPIVIAAATETPRG